MTVATVQVTREGTVVQLAIEGEVDLANRDEVAEQLYTAITNQTTSVVLDLAATSYLDSAALGLLFTLAERLELLQVELALSVPSSSVCWRVIELAGLDQVVEVRDGQ